jgi:uncharacterized protein (UPF0548 family)
MVVMITKFLSMQTEKKFLQKVDVSYLSVHTLERHKMVLTEAFGVEVAANDRQYTTLTYLDSFIF